LADTRSYKVVLDTSVIVSGFRSRRGASFAILSLLLDERFEIQISVPLAVEYESALTRSVDRLDFGPAEAKDAVSTLCPLAAKHEIFFLWRPFLPDPRDEFVLDLAVKSQCDFLVPHNVTDFAGADTLGVKVITPAAFLRILGVPS
jgi:putative PIN family toxin of toxin-antitoxin system